MNNEYKGIAAPHVYDDGAIYNDQGIQPHIAYMATFFDKESRDATGTLYAASPLLLSALINLVGTAELLWDEIKPIKDTAIMTVTHPVIEEAKRAIEAALNLKTVEK